MRRRAEEILSIERDILSAGLKVRRHGTREFHGYQIAMQMKDENGARTLLGHGTLYKALGRLEDLGFLSSRWEDHKIAEADHRPRRRLYEVTAAGQHALAAATVTARRQSRGTAARLAPSLR